MFEESPVGEHSANGEVENAIKRVQGQARTMKDALEARYKRKLDQSSNCATWLVGYAADVIKRYKVGDDGKTPWERVKGKKFKTPLVEFGEGVRYVRPESVGKNKWDVR